MFQIESAHAYEHSIITHNRPHKDILFFFMRER
jgi:hypothetical protein